MGSAKIVFKLGNIDFSGEGDEAWMSSQLDKILEKAPDLLRLVPAPQGKAGAGDSEESNDNAVNGTDVTLAKFLQDKNAAANQVKRFLATAEWLTMRGNKRPNTGDVTKALRDNHQPRLGNPADCLNKNVSKGYCEKDGRQFFVTPEGRKSLG